MGRWAISLAIVAAAAGAVGGSAPAGAAPSHRIHDIQGTAHRSPLEHASVTEVPGVVTAVRNNGFWFGDSVLVSGTVAEFRPGGSGGAANLSTTEITAPGLAVQVASGGNPLPAITIGAGGRMPPPRSSRTTPPEGTSRTPAGASTSRATASTSGRASKACGWRWRRPGSSGRPTPSARSRCWPTGSPAPAGGPAYQFRQIDPVDDADGGEPGGNIRVGFLFRTDRGPSFVDRPGGGPTTAVAVNPGPTLSVSPGRFAPTNAAFANSRKPLAGEFEWQGRRLFAIGVHFNSKGGDQPLFGRFKPPVPTTETRRLAQATVVRDFIRQLLAADPAAAVVLLGDVNDFEFSPVAARLEDGGAMHSLMKTLPADERYSYVFDGNSQTLDQMFASGMLAASSAEYDSVHLNSEFAERLSDHDPQVARFTLASEPPPVVPESRGTALLVLSTVLPLTLLGLGLGRRRRGRSRPSESGRRVPGGDGHA